MTTIRQAWRRAYSETRRRGATGREIAGIICDALEQPRRQDTFYGEHGLTALAMQQCLARARREERPLFQSLAETVLNRFGTKNPWRGGGSYGDRAWSIGNRADELRRRMIAAGRVRLDRGNWVRGVIA